MNETALLRRRLVKGGKFRARDWLSRLTDANKAHDKGKKRHIPAMIDIKPHHAKDENNKGASGKACSPACAGPENKKNRIEKQPEKGNDSQKTGTR